jgi:cyclopropane-fatty-acyl-phospholipid synthase
VDDCVAETGLSFFKELLRDFHPRNFAIRLWDGSRLDAEPGQYSGCTLVINHPGAVHRIFVPADQAALGEAYTNGDIDIEGDVETLFPLVPFLVKTRYSWARRVRLGALLLGIPRTRMQHMGRTAAKLHGRRHSRERDRQAVAYHYNVSNDFFGLFLDERMVYSCAYFEAADAGLDRAQERKLDYVCRKLRLHPGDRLLDIGCGWGALLMYAAQHYGAHGLGVTLSEPQAQLANERIRSAGLNDLCRVEVVDYRDVQEQGKFDKLVSIGMVEHVGEEMLPEYFAKAFKLLRPGGVFLNHGIARASLASVHDGPTFVDRYVFPDGDVPPIEVIVREAGSRGFEVRDVENLREHYVLTLRHWVRNLENHAKHACQATDESTYRTWRLYMAGSAHFFETGRLNVYQSLLAKPADGKSGLPLTRADWYANPGSEEWAQMGAWSAYHATNGRRILRRVGGEAMSVEAQRDEAHDESDLIFYASDRVVGIIDDVAEAQRALRDLKAAGFRADEIRVLTGENGAHRLDVKGDEHGPLAHMVRSIQNFLGNYEIQHATIYEQELLAGHFGIGVTARDIEDRDKVRKIFKAHHGHFINYYGRWTMEKLEP